MTSERASGKGFDPVGRQVNVTARATRVLLDAVLASAGATFADWTVLAALNARGPLVQKDLAKSLDMIGPSMVERIDRLEKAGLVVRSPVPGDRRASLVSMTDEGRVRFAALHEVMRATEGKLTAEIDQKDLDAALQVLARITERARSLRAELPG